MHFQRLFAFKSLLKMHWLAAILLQFTICSLVRADLLIQDLHNNTIEVLNDYELNFGLAIPDEGVLAVIQLASPLNACTPVEVANRSFPIFNSTSFKWFALVDRAIAHCDIRTKLINVMNAKFDGIIIYNANLFNHAARIMFSDEINIPVLLVSHSDGVRLSTRYTYQKNYHVLITNNSTINYYPYLLPFLAVILICLLVMLSFMISQIVRCYHERKKEMRHRLAKKYLKKLAVVNFKKGDQYEICAICLDEFTEGTKLRVLPCGHAYHLKCIDPWLTKNRRNCPICKGKVVVPGMSESESESEPDHHMHSERTPLISGAAFNYGLGPFGRRSIPNAVQSQSNHSANRNPEPESSDNPTPSSSSASLSAQSDDSSRRRGLRSFKQRRSRVLNIEAEINSNSIQEEREPMASVYESLNEPLVSTSDLVSTSASTSTSASAATCPSTGPLIVVEPTNDGQSPIRQSSDSPTKKLRRTDGIV